MKAQRQLSEKNNPKCSCSSLVSIFLKNLTTILDLCRKPKMWGKKKDDSHVWINLGHNECSVHNEIALLILSAMVSFSVYMSPKSYISFKDFLYLMLL